MHTRNGAMTPWQGTLVFDFTILMQYFVYGTDEEVDSRSSKGSDNYYENQALL